MTMNEQGVEFSSPHTGEKSLLGPEESVAIQEALGADIAMQVSGRSIE